jgi:tetratricopeptide (TPR) repeat protein
MNLNEIWNIAWEAYQNKEFNLALNYLTQIDNVHQDPAVCFVIAQSNWQLGQYQNSINYFYKAYDLDKNQVQYSLALIKALISEYKKNKAKKIVNESLSVFKNNQELLLYKALLEDKKIASINIQELIDLYNDQKANQNIINLCNACKLFKINNHSDINEAIFSTHTNSAIYESYWRIYQQSDSLQLLCFPKDLLKFALSQAKIKGHIIEAGVFFGQSINLISKFKSKQRVIGFDSFEGLPEDWNEREFAGAYSTKGCLPKVGKNVELIQGWFKDTIPEFIIKNQAPISFLHIDCDIYSSTKDILNSLASYIVVGTVILFDDFFGYDGYEQNEWKALNEFASEYKLNIHFLAFCPMGRELAIKIIE